MEPKWLEWARSLQAIAQNGLTYNSNPYDLERYEAVRHIASEMMAVPSGALPEQVVDFFARDVGYATPKVDVRGVVFRGPSILMIREADDGFWSLPGGWADVGESPAEAVAREIFEESGFRTRPTKLLALYDRSKHSHPPIPHHAYKLFFRCELLSQRAETAKPREEVAFFTENSIPELSRTRVTAGQIARAFDHYRRADLPTEFD